MAKFALSKEGTMQGNLMAMPMYALATIPLIKKVAADVKQIWYASDASAGGSVKRVLEWCQKVQDEGPPYGYYPNPAKTWLLVKEEHLSQAQEAFEGSGVNITSRGHQHLGVPIGTRRYIEEVVSNKVREWVAEIEELASFAVTQPQAAYAALTHGWRSGTILRTSFQTLVIYWLPSRRPSGTNSCQPSQEGQPSATMKENCLHYR